jgi:DNA-binding transcriptional ArsR family regulator
MSTFNPNDSLSATLFSKTRLAVLSKLFSHTDEAYYLRQIARSVGVGIGSLQRELNKLAQAGIILRMVRGNQVYYQANSQCPVFPELKSLIVKTTGAAEVIKSALTSLTHHIRVAFIYGSVARMQDKKKSDVDLMIIGDVKFAEVVSALDKAQQQIEREINPTVYPLSEFQLKFSEGNHFIKTLMRETKLFLIGDQRELTRLAKKQLAD